MKLLLVITFLLLGALVHTSEAVDCYVCNTEAGDNNCRDTYTPVSSQLTTGCTYCSKAKAAASGTQAIVRACATIGAAPYIGCQSGSQGGVSADICVCTSDKCNGAGHVTLTFTSLLGVLLAYWLL